jgi:hypothetical protein
MKKVLAVLAMVMVAGFGQAATVSNAIDVVTELWGAEAVTLITNDVQVRNQFVNTLNWFEGIEIAEQDYKVLLAGTWPNSLTMVDALKLTSGGRTEPEDPPLTFRRATIMRARQHIAKLAYAEYDKTSMDWAVARHNVTKNRGNFKYLFGDHAQALVRRKLRDDGKGIVTVNGTNPVAVAMAPVIAAANAPMLQGLEEAFLDVMGETVSVDRSTQAEYEALRDAVWVGAVVANRDIQEKLIFLMGVSNYNAWVEEFNAQ